ncbi:hypothetical protein LNK20_19785, partial [Bacillus safensis]|uniref:hypothetical protein n=1 Tax=Bacillus safensis TaxID=561879 RepID=UPI001FF839A9
HSWPLSTESYRPHTNDRRAYGRFHWATIGALDWSEVYKPIFMNWAMGIENLVDRQAREAGDDDVEE